MLTRFAARSLPALLLALSLATPALAQSDILMRLRSGSPPGDRFRVDSAGGVVAIGVVGNGIIPASGLGTRMMWYPFKSAFRAGTIAEAGTMWDDANIGFYTWAGGYNTRASGISSFAFGYNSEATTGYSVALGAQNHATGQYSVALGYQNTASGSSAISIGSYANATGTGGLSIGYRTTADANYSTAIGYRASANGHAGAIVLSDASTTDSLEASANNQFSVRAAGGIRLFTNATSTTGVQVAAGGSSWSVVSDRNRKHGFLATDGEDVLRRLRSVPVSTWFLTSEADSTVRHMGPMAQDWHAAFAFNRDSTTINMSDLDGVNLAAVKALDARTQQLLDENVALKKRLEDLEARLRALEVTRQP